MYGLLFHDDRDAYCAEKEAEESVWLNKIQKMQLGTTSLKTASVTGRSPHQQSWSLARHSGWGGVGGCCHCRKGQYTPPNIVQQYAVVQSVSLLAGLSGKLNHSL